jgi:hypothetical protein
MPRILSPEDNTLTMIDNVSGSEIVFTYRMPTTAERTAYANAAWPRRGNKVKNETTKARLTYGERILKSIRDGDFLVPVNGKNEPLSSTPGNPGYREDWKALVMQFAPDLVELLAARVFDASAEALTPDDLSEEDSGENAGKS